MRQISEREVVKELISILVVLIVLTQNAVAETLNMPMFTHLSPWSNGTTASIKSNDGKVLGEITSFRPLADNETNPKNIASMTVVTGLSKNIGAVEYLTLLAQGMQQNCESMQLTRPKLLLEKHTPVSYATLYCSKIKKLDIGVIQTIKTLQGKDTMYAVIREWRVPSFNSDIKPSITEEFANSIFKSASEASDWIRQMTDANDHLANQVSICANKQGEFGDTCASQ